MDSTINKLLFRKIKALQIVLFRTGFTFKNWTQKLNFVLEKQFFKWKICI